MRKNKKNVLSMRNSNGFTLLELLIVIAIIAILSVALVLVLNPAETLKKSRDAQRMADLATLKTAIGLYMTNVSPAYLGGAADNNLCKATITDVWGVTPATAKVSYSIPTASATISDTTIDGGSVGPRQLATMATMTVVDGTGWIPVNFGAIASGTPISNLPIDPTNTITAVAAVASTDLVYRYGCVASPLAYEIDAQLESTAYTVTDDKRASDGGNNANLYETGTNLKVLGTSTDF